MTRPRIRRSVDSSEVRIGDMIQLLPKLLVSARGRCRIGAELNPSVHTAWSDAENRHDLSRHHDFVHDDTAKRIESAGVSLWEFDAGKAQRAWIYADVAALISQLM